VHRLHGLHCHSGDHSIALGDRFAALRDCLIAFGERFVALSHLRGSTRGLGQHILTRRHRLPQNLKFLQPELELHPSDLLLLLQLHPADLLLHIPLTVFDAERFAPSLVA